jgi:hypothetical protein
MFCDGLKKSVLCLQGKAVKQTAGIQIMPGFLTEVYSAFNQSAHARLFAETLVKM